MSALSAAWGSRPFRRTQFGGAGGLGLGAATLWLSLIVLLPLAAVADRSFQDGLGAFWSSVSGRQAVAALRFTLTISLLVTAINVVMGTLIAWVLVRDQFRGKRVIPGTPIFDGDAAVRGYPLNAMCFSFNDAANRAAFLADERALLLKTFPDEMVEEVYDVDLLLAAPA